MTQDYPENKIKSSVVLLTSSEKCWYFWEEEILASYPEATGVGSGILHSRELDSTAGPNQILCCVGSYKVCRTLCSKSSTATVGV